MKCLHMRANTLKREKNIVRKCLSQFIFQCIHTEQYLRIYALMDFYQIITAYFSKHSSVLTYFDQFAKYVIRVNQTFAILIMFHAFTSVAIKLYTIPELP